MVPLFLFAATHAKRDVPALMVAAQEKHTGTLFHYGRPLGVHPLMVRSCLEHQATTEAAAQFRDRPETAVLLVGRGSSDPHANADLFKVACLLREESCYGIVECAYRDVTTPKIPDGLRRCIKLGARRVLLPYFLFKGVLMDQIQAILGEWQAATPNVEFLLAGAEGLAAGVSLLGLILERAEEALGTRALDLEISGRVDEVKIRKLP